MLGQRLEHCDVTASIINTEVVLLRYKINLEMSRIIDLTSRNKLTVQLPVLTADFTTENSEYQKGNFQGHPEIYW